MADCLGVESIIHSRLGEGDGLLIVGADNKQSDINDSLFEDKRVIVASMGKTGGKQCATALSSVERCCSVDML